MRPPVRAVTVVAAGKLRLSCGHFVRRDQDRPVSATRRCDHCREIARALRA